MKKKQKAQMETEGAFCQTGYCSYFANAFMRELSKDKDIN